MNEGERGQTGRHTLLSQFLTFQNSFMHTLTESLVENKWQTNKTINTTHLFFFYP